MFSWIIHSSVVICFVFVLTWEHRWYHPKNKGKRGKEKSKSHDSDMETRLTCTKRKRYFWNGERKPKYVEHQSSLHTWKYKHLEGMTSLWVPYLMSQYCNKFLSSQILDKRVKKDDTFFWTKTWKVRICLRASLTSIYNIDICSRKSYLFGKTHNSVFKFSILKRCLLIKYRNNQAWVKHHKEKWNPHREKPGIYPETRSDTEVYPYDKWEKYSSYQIGK